MTTYLDYARRGRNDWWRYAAALCLAVVFAVVGVFVLAAILDAANLLPQDFASRVQDPSEPVGFFLANGVIFALLVAGLAAAVRLAHQKRAVDLLGAWTWRGYLAGVAIWTLVLVVAALIDFALAPKGFRISISDRTPMLLAAAVPALAIQTFAEEYVFRGYLTQGLLLASRQPAVTALVSGLLFGALHIPNGTPQAVSAAVFGIVLSFIAIRTGGIAFTCGLHFINNLFGAVVVVSGGDVFRNSPGLITQTTPHLMWWDTAVGVAALIGLAILIVRRPRLAGSGEI